MVKIKTPNGEYEVERPGGPIGALDMTIMGRLMMIDGLMELPIGDTEDPELMKKISRNNSKITVQAMFDIFKDWSTQVLPHMKITGTYTYETMPGIDQFAIFLKFISELMATNDFFQDVAEVPKG